MELIVRHAGEEWRVEARPDGDGFEVRVGERVYRVDRASAGDGVRSLVIDGRQYEVSVRAEPDGRYQVSAAGSVAAVEVRDPLTHLAEASRGGADRQGPRRVTAYMPGRVVALLVDEGEKVAAGQGVLVLEAMKMQNEIQVEHDAVVRRFHVAPGQAVEGGDPLFEIE